MAKVGNIKYNKGYHNHLLLESNEGGKLQSRELEKLHFEILYDYLYLARIAVFRRRESGNLFVKTYEAR